MKLDQVRRDYSRFLEQAGGLFEEVWLINLDDIPGSPDRPASEAETAASIRKSDENLAVLQAEFGDRVLPVFHQHEGKARLLEVIDQASGYLCLSPTNGLPEEERWRWAQLARSALDELRCDVRTHGLATTGNQMIREAHLYSGDSAAWRRHGGFGLVDLVRHEATVAENVELARGSQEWLSREIVERQRPFRVSRILRSLRPGLTRLTLGLAATFEQFLLSCHDTPSQAGSG